MLLTMGGLVIPIASCVAAAAAGIALAASLPMDGPSGAAASAADDARPKADPPALAVYGIAAVVHHDGDGNVIGEQAARNRLLDAGEDFILQQVFMDGRALADSAQIGAICLSADDTEIAEELAAAAFNANHEADADTASTTTTSTTAARDTRECLTDRTVGGSGSGQAATVGPLTFTANNTESPDDSRSNWKPGVPIKMLGICRGFDAAGAERCTPPLFAAVDINDVILDNDETLTVTYTFNMSTDGA